MEPGRGGAAARVKAGEGRQVDNFPWPSLKNLGDRGWTRALSPSKPLATALQRSRREARELRRVRLATGPGRFTALVRVPYQNLIDLLRGMSAQAVLTPGRDCVPDRERRSRGVCPYDADLSPSDEAAEVAGGERAQAASRW